MTISHRLLHAWATSEGIEYALYGLLPDDDRELLHGGIIRCEAPYSLRDYWSILVRAGVCPEGSVIQAVEPGCSDRAYAGVAVHWTETR